MTIYDNNNKTGWQHQTWGMPRMRHVWGCAGTVRKGFLTARERQLWPDAPSLSAEDGAAVDVDYLADDKGR